ncbi:MAG: hypothetical protein WAK91_10225, partial [Candidatus Acidiferrales bacterium]
MKIPLNRQISRDTKSLETPEMIENKARTIYFAAQSGALHKSQLLVSPFPSSLFRHFLSLFPPSNHFPL